MMHNQKNCGTCKDVWRARGNSPCRVWCPGECPSVCRDWRCRQTPSHSNFSRWSTGKLLYKNKRDDLMEEKSWHRYKVQCAHHHTIKKCWLRSKIIIFLIKGCIKTHQQSSKSARPPHFFQRRKSIDHSWQIFHIRWRSSNDHSDRNMNSLHSNAKSIVTNICVVSSLCLPSLLHISARDAHEIGHQVRKCLLITLRNLQSTKHTQLPVPEPKKLI